MRNIEFRAKIKGDAGIYKVWSINWLDQKMLVERACGNKWVAFDKVEGLMQFTGLTDKNKARIFEGDIVADTDLVIDDVISVIEWGQCDELSDYTTERTTMSGWVANSKLYGVSPFFPYSCTKVIGNVYQNSHLLDTT